jgi:predicted nucleic acid-binding protein
MEYEEILMRFYTKPITDSVMGFIIHSVNMKRVAPYYKWHLISVDPDDNKFVDCALNVGADYIVTNDHHFDILKTLDFPPINVINMDAFKNLIVDV